MMGHRFFLALMTGFLMVMSGCGGGTPSATTTTTTEAAPELPFQWEVLQVDLYGKIGSKNAVAEGGQLVIVTVSFQNNVTEDLTFSPTEFKIRNITSKPEEQYEQAVEPSMSDNFKKEFGAEAMSKLLTDKTVIHPRFTVEKILIYKLPIDAMPDGYELKYEPKGAVTPLVGTVTQINSHLEAV